MNNNPYTFWTDNGRPTSAGRATICLLTFGEYVQYFRRSLVSILRTTPHEEIELRLGFNDSPHSFYYALGRLWPGISAPPHETLAEGIERYTFTTPRGMTVRMWNSDVNLYKSRMCRVMFYDVPLDTSEYVLWLDDDTFVKPGWWPALRRHMDQHIDYIGQHWWAYYLPGQTEMIQAQPWYRGVPFLMREGRPGISFATGGFVCLRSERVIEANFPDTEISWKGQKLTHHGDDTLLGEIARQLGWSSVHHDQNILINVDMQERHPAPRRGHDTGRQFGSDVDIALS